MADMIYTVEKDGKQYKIQAPEGTSPDQLEKAIAPQPYDVEPGVASAMNVVDSMGFGFPKNLDSSGRYRATLDKFKQENPGSAMLGDVSGAALPALVAGAAYPILGGGWGTTAVVGGTEAMVRGANDSISDPKRTSEDVPFDASKALMMGAVAGPLAQKGVEGTGAAVRAGGGLMSKIPYLGPKLTEILSTNAVARAFNRDKIDVDQLTRNMGPEARTVDYGGRNVNQALDTNATLPGETAQLVDQAVLARKQGARDRLMPMVEEVAGTPQRASVVYESWQAQKESAAAPLYERLRQINVPNTAALSDQLAAAQQLGAFAEAEKQAIARRMPFTLDPNAQAMSMRDLDNVKRGLDQLIAKQTGPDGKMTPLGLAYNDLRTNYIKTLDNLTRGRSGVSAYEEARNAFAGPAALQDALQAGRRVFTLTDDAIQANMAAMSSSERDAFRIGAAEGLRQKIGSRGGRTEVLNLENNNFQDKLRLVFGNQQKFDDAMALIARERKFRELEQVNQGSATARRLAAMEDQSLETAGDVASIVGNAKNPVGMFGPLRRLSTNLSTPENVRNKIGEMLLEKNANWQAIAEAQKALKARQLAASLSASSVGGQQASIR